MYELYDRYSRAIEKNPVKTLVISALACLLPMIPIQIMFVLPDSTRYIDGIEVLAIFCFGLFVIGVIGELIVFTYALIELVNYSPKTDKQITANSIDDNNQGSYNTDICKSKTYTSAAVAGFVAAETSYRTNDYDSDYRYSDFDDCDVSEERVYEAFDEYGDKMDELDFELADGYYDEFGDYHKKTGFEDIDFDNDYYVDPDIDEELDVIYRNEAIKDSMDMFGFGDDRGW